MFRSSTILRELVQSLAKVIFLSKYSVKLCRCILCGDVSARRETACVLFVVELEMLQHVVKRRVCCLLCRLSISLHNDNYVYSSVKLNFSKFNKKCNCW